MNDRLQERHSANRAIHGPLNALLAAGYDEQDLANVMVAYSVHIMRETHGSEDLSIHFARLSAQEFGEAA